MKECMAAVEKKHLGLCWSNKEKIPNKKSSKFRL